MNTTHRNNSIRNSGLLQAGAISAVAAAVVSSVLYGIGHAAGLSYDLVDNGTAKTVEFFSVAPTSTSSMAVGLLGVAVAYRFFGRRSLRPFAVLGIVLALASSGSFPAAEADTGTKWVLFSMHVVTGLAYAGGLEIVRSRIPATTRQRNAAEDELVAAIAAA